jgi:acetolactate synthase-1/2/3 large subunit
MMRVADYMAKKVVDAGTECFFMLSGGMAMHLNDAFGRVEGLRYYCNHHEQASAMAAEAYARETGKLGVCVVTSGPGATNILTGLVGAYQDSVPVLYITGQCKRVETVRWRGISGLRQCGFLEVDIIPIVESVTKYAAFVESPERARFHMEKAIHLATTGRPGPVLLDIPLDVQGAPFSEADSEPYLAEDILSDIPKASDINEIFNRLQTTKRPIILAGHGIRCAGSVDLFRTFVRRMHIPVLTTMMAKDLMPYDDPLFVGHCGPRGLRGSNYAVQSADLILIMGCSLHIQTVGYEGNLFAPNAYKIQIDLDKSLHERASVGANVKYAWDIKQYLPLFITRSENYLSNMSPDWVKACETWKHTYGIMKEPHNIGNHDSPINLYEFTDVLCDELKGNETILTDAGQPHPILGQAFRTKGSQRYLNPGSMAEMGYAIPASFGPASVAQDRNVIVIIGDGSLQTNIQELQTIVHYGFNIKLFVINNGGYGSIRRTQETFFKGFFVGSTPESGVSMPDSERICAAYGLPFVRIENRSMLRTIIKNVLSQPGPLFCEVMAQYDQKIIPGVPSYLLEDGSMRSKALHEMAPDNGLKLEDVIAQENLE